MAEAITAAAIWVGNTVGTAVGSALTAAGVSSSVALPIAAFAANVAYGVSAIALYAGMQYAIDAVSQPKIKPPGSELQFNIDPDYPREMIIGQRLVGGSMVARYSRESNLYNAHLVIQVADHPCHELSKVYDGGRLVRDTALTHGARTEITAYSNSGGARVWMTWHDGRPGQTADSDLVTKSAQDPEVVAGKIEGWTSSHTGAGCAYVHVEVQWDSDILTSIPQFQFLVKGAKLYDRRLDTTAGGSGSHRHGDPSTWAYSTNAMLAMDHFLLGYEVEDDPLAFGIGLSATEVPYAQFEAAADLCDEDVETGVGGAVETIKRYAVNGVISAGDYFEEVVEALQLQMAARVVDLGGRIGILGAEERAITVSLTEDDLVAGEPLQFADKLQFTDLIGTVTGTFSDPANNYQPSAYAPLVSAYAALPDGGEAQATTLPFPYETHPRRVVRLATAWLERESLQPRLAGVFMPKAWKLEPGDWFEFTSARLQLTAAKFEVIDIVKNDDFTVTITARAIDPDFLAFDNDNDPDLSVPPDVDPVERILDAPTFTPTATTITGGGATEPVIQVVVDAPNPVTREIVIEAKEWTGSALTGPSLMFVGHADDLTSILRQGLKPSTAYKVRMKARAGARESAWSAWSSAITMSATYIVPAASSAAPGSDLDVDFSAAIAAAAAAAASAVTAASHATNAATAETNAETAETAAEAALASATTQASNAATSASAAGASATSASGSAATATTQAGLAATSASAAQVSLISARATASRLLPSTFGEEAVHWTNQDNGSPEAVPDSTIGTYPVVTGVGKVWQVAGGYGYAWTKGVIKPATGRTYRAKMRWRVTANRTDATATSAYVQWCGFNASYGAIAYSASQISTAVAADGWKEFSCDFSPGTTYAYIRPLIIVNGDTVGPNVDDGTAQVEWLITEDVTGVLAADASAAASATSASSAAASQSAAASSASAASTSATNAATQAGNAATSASQASTSETNAAGSASTASTAATAAASSQSAAAGSASAAAGSASTATTQASNAATSASAASTSATNASTSASNASTSAGQASTSAGNAASSASTATTQAGNAAASATTATTQASAASASAAAASSSATLSAQFATAAINLSANFADNANATGAPTNWSNWQNASTATRVTGISPSPYAWKIPGAAGSNGGVRQAVTNVMAGWYVLEADVELTAGAFDGAGVTLYSQQTGQSDIDIGIAFKTDADVSGSAPGAGSTGKIYRYRKLVQFTHTAPNATWPAIYAMSHYATHGSMAAANEIVFHRCAIRAASQAEIEARQAKLDLVTANASIAVNASAIATEAAARAVQTTELYASIGSGINLLDNSALWGSYAAAGGAISLPTMFAYYFENDPNNRFSWGAIGTSALSSQLVPGLGGIYVEQTADATYGGAHYGGFETLKVPVVAGKRYMASVYVGANPAQFGFYTRFYKSDGSTTTGLSAASSAPTSKSGGVNLGDWNRWWYAETAPSDAQSMTITIYRIGSSGGSTSYGSFMLPMIEEMRSGQTTPSPWAPGRNDGNYAAVLTNAAAIVTVDGKLSASYALTVDVNGRIASVKLLSNGVTSAVKFTASTFTVYDGASDVAMFEVAGGAAYVAGARVRTESMAANAVTTVSSAYTTGTSGSSAVGDGWKRWQSLAVTTAGGALVINASVVSTIKGFDTDTVNRSFRIRRGTTTVYQASLAQQAPGGQTSQIGWSASIVDAPAAGSYTYYIETTTDVSPDVDTCDSRALIATELKR